MAVSELFTRPEKQRIREAVARIGSRVSAAAVLDLYGDGASAREFRRQLPAARLVSAETDPSRWPLLGQDAARLGFEPFYGSASGAEGPFDLAYLDFTGHWGSDKESEIRAVAAQLSTSGVLAVTLRPDRVAGEGGTLIRLHGYAGALVETAQLPLRFFTAYPAQRGGRSEMWLFVLSKWGRRYRASSSAYLYGDYRRNGYWVADDFRRLIGDGGFLKLRPVACSFCGETVWSKRSGSVTRCTTCRSRHRSSVKATCHPDRQHIGRGLCKACYEKWNRARLVVEAGKTCALPGCDRFVARLRDTHCGRSHSMRALRAARGDAWGKRRRRFANAA